MKIHKKSVLLFLCLMGIQLVVLSKSTIAQSYSQIKLDLKRVPWTQLSYRINKLSVEVNAQVRLESLPAAEVEAALIKSPQGDPIEVWLPESNRISVYYNVNPIFLSPVKTINHVWFNPQDATALGRIRQRRGKEDFKKVYRFSQQGVFRHRREPKDQHETPKQPDKWTDVKDTFYAYNLEQLGCPSVTERTVLIYIASAAELSKSMQPLSFCVFGRRQLFHVQLKPAELSSLKVDFIEKSQQGQMRRQGEIEALKIALEVQPLASDLEKVEDFSFLGFQDNIAIYIDPLAGLPIQISGIISKVGNVTIKLAEVQLR